MESVKFFGTVFISLIAFSIVSKGFTDKGELSRFANNALNQTTISFSVVTLVTATAIIGICLGIARGGRLPWLRVFATETLAGVSTGSFGYGILLCTLSAAVAMHLAIWNDKSDAAIQLAIKYYMFYACAVPVCFISFSSILCYWARSLVSSQKNGRTL